MTPIWRRRSRKRFAPIRSPDRASAPGFLFPERQRRGKGGVRRNGYGSNFDEHALRDRAATEANRTMRGGYARAPSGGDLLATLIAGSPSKPGCAARSPGFFVFMRPAGGTGIRACLRSTIFRVRIPGGVPDFVLRGSESSRLLFYNLDVAKQPRRACNEPSVDLRAARRGGVFPSSNGEDGGLSSRQCRFDSGRERHRIHLAVAQPGKRASFGTRRPQVRILPARPIYSPVAQWNRERAVTTPPLRQSGRGFESLLGCQSRRRNSEERVPACRAGGRGFKSRRCRQGKRGA